MRLFNTCLCLFLLVAAFHCDGQIFWYENFDLASGSVQVNSYTSTNGAWSLTTNVTVTEGASANPWFVSCKEAGHVAGVCGTTCAASAGLGPTLHVGSVILGDQGASYDAGSGLGDVTTSRRAESPTINCSGHSNITIRFYYIENGDGTNDDGSVWYYDGSTWALLTNTAKTPTACAPQGQWTMYTQTLPVSANNNPNVKIGFLWVNNNDGVGTDPSYAIDSISLSTAAASAPPVASYTTSVTTTCQDSCITFTSTSTGTIDSVRWSSSPTTSVTIASPTANVSSICFHAAGTFSVTLTAYGGGGSNTSTHVITVNPAPHPVITKTGHTFSVTSAGPYTSYQWVKNTSTIITGATNSSYTYTVAATYNVIVDSAGCYGMSNTISTLGVNTVTGNGESYWLSQTDNNSIDIFASEILHEPLNVVIYDATGRQMMTEIWNAGNNSLRINTSFLPPGLYIVRLSNNTGTIFRYIK